MSELKGIVQRKPTGVKKHVQMTDIYSEVGCWAFWSDFKGRPSWILLKAFSQ